jgi:hypothetical protein
VSDQHAWLSGGLSELVVARIRETLQPLLDEYGDLARSVGGGFDRQVERAHYIGQAQGVADALNALLPVFGVEAPGGPARPVPAEAPAARVSVVPPWPPRGPSRQEWRMDASDGVHRASP